MNSIKLKIFVADCLLINLCPKKKSLVLNKLKSNKIDWDTVVKITTNQLILPAIYFNLKRANFLSYIPKELIEHMKYISDLNYERNLKIIKQCHDINSILKSNNIFPVFLKGACNLLSNLYENISERMLGDIDFIVPKKDYKKTIEIIKSEGYVYVDKSSLHFPEQRHYRRLKKKGSIAAIEIHKDLILDNYKSEFNYLSIKSNLQVVNGFYTLGLTDMLSLSIFSNQINDYGFCYKSISLKSFYDVILISTKLKGKFIQHNYKKLKKSLVFFLNVTNLIFDKPKIIDLNKNKTPKIYLYLFKNNLKNNYTSKLFRFIIKYYLFISYRLGYILTSFNNKNYRIWLYKRLKK